MWTRYSRVGAACWLRARATLGGGRVARDERAASRGRRFASNADESNLRARSATGCACAKAGPTAAPIHPTNDDRVATHPEPRRSVLARGCA
ncbi:hypothetical protein A6456_22905 [Paraburkholderia tropica]|nr:hypothetical protein A6456_22905 [Paraburkholderia tropica]